MLYKYKIYFFLFYLALTLPSCQCNQTKDPHKEVTPEKSFSLQSIRLDSIVFHTPYISDADYQKQMVEKSNQSVCVLVEDLLRMGPCQDSSTFRQLQGFATFKDMVDLQKVIETSFTPDVLTALKNELTRSFELWTTHLSKETPPTIVWMNGSLATSSYAKDNHLYIGLDSYLYPNPIVKEFPVQLFPLYKRKNMQPKYLVTNALFNWVSYKIEQIDTIAPAKNDFLESLIYAGKIMYATDILQPEVGDSIKMMWTPEELEWAQDHELMVWKEIAQQKVMFGTKKEDIYKWFNEAPHTMVGNIPSDSPAQLGIWMGWQIVRAYMTKNENVSLEALLKEKNNQKILSAYKPNLP